LGKYSEFLLSLPLAPLLSWDIPVDTGLLCDKAALLGATISDFVGPDISNDRVTSSSVSSSQRRVQLNVDTAGLTQFQACAILNEKLKS
jgi:hypothetical protein